MKVEKFKETKCTRKSLFCSVLKGERKNFLAIRDNKILFYYWSQQNFRKKNPLNNNFTYFFLAVFYFFSESWEFRICSFFFHQNHIACCGKKCNSERIYEFKDISCRFYENWILSCCVFFVNMFLWLFYDISNWT